MEQIKYLILGAGPAGLAFACRLKQKGETAFFVLEKETEAGGLCRSRTVDGAPLDIGGGHFLDVRRPAVDEFLFGFMPEDEWDRYERNSKIAFDGGYIDHPFEANIWQMKPEKQREYMESIACAGCNRGEEMPEEFVDWIYWKLGKKIAEEYMLPYNRKMFGANLNRLGTYWLEKLPNVSYEETKLSCENKRPYGQQPGHAQFFYPKQYGFGEVWLRMQKELGDRIRLETAVNRMEILPDGRKRVTCRDSSVYEAEKVITTIPWAEWEVIEGMPEELCRDRKKLCHSSIQIEYCSGHLDTDAQWIYYPQEEISYHRILVRHNFCPDSEGYWTETNIERMEPDTGRFRYEAEYAYPLNTAEKPEIMDRLLVWARTKDIYGLGRWGEHEHYNSDLVVELAMKLADELISSGSQEGKGFGV